MRLLRPLLGSLLLVLVVCGPPLPAHADAAQTQTDDASIASRIKEPRYVSLLDELHKKYGFARPELERLFTKATFLPEVPQRFEKPAELMPYNQYRKIFITPENIANARNYMARNAALLQAVEEQYGVDAAVIASILSVETKFGKRTDGGFLVFDALNSTFAGVPTREAFARRELIEFLLLCREEKLDPLDVKGSYAGAMGAPQFIASSYRAYAVDFDHDGKRDLWQSEADILGSVANYLSIHGWQKGAPIQLPVTADGRRPTVQALLDQGVKHTTTVETLLGTGIAWAGTPPPPPIDGDEQVSLLAYPMDDGEHTAVLFPNFKSILTYNHAVNYALVVSELAALIAQPDAPAPQ
jgi:membrane-bound lytic murein transglycosylase B